MDGSDAINAIGSIGFPIVACVGLFSLYDKILKEVITALAEVKSTLNHLNVTLNSIENTLEDMNHV